MAKRPSYKWLEVNERRRQLLDAETALFAQQAYEGISARAVARARRRVKAASLPLLSLQDRARA